VFFFWRSLPGSCFGVDATMVCVTTIYFKLLYRRKAFSEMTVINSKLQYLLWRIHRLKAEKSNGKSREMSRVEAKLPLFSRIRLKKVEKNRIHSLYKYSEEFRRKKCNTTYTCPLYLISLTRIERTKKSNNLTQNTNYICRHS
jgi:hypothetical protein